MADHRDPLAALGPVAAGHVFAAGESRAVRFRAGKDVVLVRRVAAPVDDVSFFGQRGLLVEVVFAVQLGNVAGNDDSFGVLPRTVADAIARVDCLRAGRRTRAEIRAPGVISRAGRCCERLTMLVCARQPAEIRALAGTRAGHEKSHGRLLRLCNTATAENEQRDRCGPAESPNGHRLLRSLVVQTTASLCTPKACSSMATVAYRETTRADGQGGWRLLVKRHVSCRACGRGAAGLLSGPPRQAMQEIV